MIARPARRIALWRELRAALVGAAAATGATLAAWLAFAAWVTIYLSLTAPGVVGELPPDAARVVPFAVLVGAVTNVGTALGVRRYARGSAPPSRSCSPGVPSPSLPLRS